MRVAELRVLIGAIDAAIEGLNQFYRSPVLLRCASRPPACLSSSPWITISWRSGRDHIGCCKTQWSMEGDAGIGPAFLQCAPLRGPFFAE